MSWIISENLNPKNTLNFKNSKAVKFLRKLTLNSFINAFQT